MARSILTSSSFTTVDFKGKVISILCSMMGGPAALQKAPQSLTSLGSPAPSPRCHFWTLSMPLAYKILLSSLDREAVDLGSHPSLLRVTLGKVNSEDLSLHLEDRDNNHCLTQWGVHSVIGAGRLLSTFPEPFLLLCSGISFLYLEVFLLRLPLGHCLNRRKTWRRNFTHHTFSQSCPLLAPAHPHTSIT